MQVRIREHIVDRAEGDCIDFPYNTELVSSQGVSILFWLGDNDPKQNEVKTALERALRVARNNRDVVCAIACPGNPLSYWAHNNMQGG